MTGTSLSPTNPTTAPSSDKMSAAGAAAGGKKKAAATTVDLKSIPEPEGWSQRIAIFETRYAQQQAEYDAKKAPIKVTLPDGKVMEATSWVDAPIDLAKRISNSLPDRVIVARVNDQLWDLSRPFEEDAVMELLDWDDKEAKEVFWHSSCHILGYAMERTFGAKLSVGPPLEEGGFFYEGMTDRPVSEGDYKLMESAMQELVKQKTPYQRLTISKADALAMFSYTDFKTKILNSLIPDDGTVTVYRCGSLIDPCRGPHISDTGRVKAFAVTKNSSSYFEGKAENEVLQRVYGIAFPKAAMLTEWKTMQEEAAKRDHRNIGRQQQLFHFNEVSPGSAFWLPHGARIFNALINFQKKQYWKRGFEEVMSPNIYSSKLWMVSGHWDKYSENMFKTVCEKEDYALKPMNCPGHCMMFASQPHSYRELPIRYADFGVLHRNELSGALTGLTRVRRFQQDDAHIFCRMDQVTDEISGALNFLSDVYGTLGFKFHLCHSTRPENKLGSEEIWDKAESFLRTALNKFCDIPDDLADPFRAGETFYFDGRPDAVKKLKAIMKELAAASPDAAVDPASWKGPVHPDAWYENTGDGAFYGPKIDIIVEDALKRRHQCATIQLDFNLPNRFGLKYTLPSAETGAKEGDTNADVVAEKKKRQEEARAHAKAIKDAGAAGAPCPCHADPGALKPVLTAYEQAIKDLGIDLELDPNQARPVMIHRAILGSVERSIAILCEHYGGEWPLWLSPRQVLVVPISNANADYALELRNHFHNEGFHADVDLGAATLDKKIRNAEMARYNFIFVVGQKEQETRGVNIRARGERRIGDKTLEEATKWLHELANSYSREF